MLWLILQILILFVSGGELSREYNVYVSNHALDEQGDGSEERPFMQLNDALNEVKLKFSEYDQINILIAASETAYFLKNGSYSFDGENSISLTFSTWTNQSGEEQEKACINLSGGTQLNMRNLISLKMSSLDIVEQNASLIVKNSSSLFFEDMKFNLSNKENPFLTVVDGLGLVMKRLDIKYRISSAFLSYSFKKEAKLKQVLAERILLTYLWDQEDFQNARGLRERNPMFSIFGAGAYQRENLLNISKVEIETKNSHQLIGSAKRLFEIERFDQVEISEVVADSQLLWQTRDRLFQIKDANSVELKKINFTNNIIMTLTQGAFFDLSFLTSLKISELNFSGNKLISDFGAFTLVGIGSTHSSTIEHHEIRNNSNHKELELIRYVDYRPNDMSLVSTSLKISNIAISDNKNELTTNQFTYISYLGPAFEELEVENVNFYNNSISGRIFSFQSRPYRMGLGPKEIVSPRKLNFSHINVRNNPRIFDVNLIYFFSLISAGSTNECPQLIEPYRLWIENLTVTENAFIKDLNDLWMFEACLLEVQEAQVYLVNSQISNNYFEFYNFLSFERKAATVVFLGNRFKNNTLNGSQLINTAFVSYDSACNVIREGTIYPSKVLYRYSKISNSSFSDIKAVSGAILFAINNNFLSFSQNNLSQILLLNNSLFMKSRINVPQINLNPNAYIKDLSIEKLALNNFSGEDAFGQGISSWSLIKNNFTDVTTDNNAKFIELVGYGSALSSQRIERNLFLNVSFSSEGSAASLFESDDLEMGIYSYNRFENISGKVCIFSISKSKDLKLLSMQGNDVRNGSVNSFVSFTGENAAAILFKENSFWLVKFSEACLTINVKNAVGDWKIYENNLTDSLLSLSQSSIETDGYGLFSIYAEHSSMNAEVWFSRNTFSNLSAQFLARKSLETNFHLLLIELKQRVIFQGNSLRNLRMHSQGSLLQFNYVPNLVVDDCTFKDIQFDGKTGLISTSAREIRVINSTFENVMNEGSTGIMVLLIEKPQHYFVTLENSGIQNLTAQSHLYNKISPLILEINYLTGKGVLDYEIAQFTVLTLEARNCSIENLYQGAAFALNQITCKECLIQDTRFLMTDEAAFTRELFYFSESVRGNFTLQNVTFPKHSTSQKSFIKIEFSFIDLKLENMYFSGDERGSSLVSLDSGALLIVNSTFENIVLDQVPFIYSVLRDQERYYDSGSPQIPLITIENTTFRNMKKRFIPKSSPLLEILDYVYTSEEPIKVSSVIFCAIPAFLLVDNCTFSNSELVNAITFVDSVYQRKSKRPITFDPSIYVINSLFADLKSNLGSAIMVNQIQISPHVDILNSSFNRNFAYIGGAMSIYSGNLSMRNSSFFENHAAYMGAVIMRNEFSIEKDIYEGLEFSRNKAQYGAEDPKGGKFIAFEATSSKLSFMTRNPQANRVIFESNSLFNVSTKDFNQSFLVMEFFDANGNSAPDLSGSRKASFLVPHARKRDQVDVLGGSIIKKHDLYVHISLNEVAISGKAHEIVNITLEYSSDKLYFVHNISIHFRECLSGEYNNTIMCEVCSGLTYSFDPQTSCTKCPANADCTVPGKVLPNKGFWNAHPQSDKIFACREDDIVRCPGDKMCADGYKGPLCNACDLDNSYVENGYLKCAICTNPFKSLMFSILSVLLYAAYQLFSINAIYTGNSQISGAGIDYLTKRKIERSFYVKLLLTYTQLMSILYMASPEIAKSFGLTSQIGDPVSLISHGMQCSLQALKIDPPNFLYSQILLSLLSPIGQFGIIFVYLLPLKLWNREKSIFKLLLVAVSYLIMSFQPGIVTSLTSFLSCSTIQGVDLPSFVTSHPYWSCESDPYPFYAQYVAKPSLILWSVLIPVTIFAILFMNRKNLQAPKLKMSLGVLYSDLKEEYYFWGIVLMAFKLILSPLAREIDKNSEVPVFLVLMLLWIYQAFLRKIKPYKTNKFNNLEIVLINLLIVNIIMTRYFFNPENSSGIKLITLALIIAANGGFLIVLGFKILSASWIQIIGFIERKIMKRNIARDPKLLLQDFDSTQVEKL